MKKLFLGMLLVGFMGCLMLSTGCAGTDASQKTMQSEGAMQKEGETMMEADAPMKKEASTRPEPCRCAGAGRRPRRQSATTCQGGARSACILYG